ncbi:MAG TPA: 4Fe-4S dicluster domain-containing protein [Tepidisphaeraceae bacterium]|nr:4Fe-4S dicluster domain-containing protein [Tepidisphaeraceae bacterium]
MPDDRHVNRRRFFREGLRELLRPLSKAVEPINEVARHFGEMDFNAPTPLKPKTPKQTVWQRPPGALEGNNFTDVCSRCGECVKVCPAECIRIDPTGERGDGAPYIQPNDMPCVMCNGLLCMHVCPTGALRPIPIQDIDMGTARWREETCVRTIGENCTICVDQCPMGEAALVLNGNRVVVKEEGCTGCGVCQHYCPTSPKSIVVTPRDARGGDPFGGTVPRSGI